MSKTFFRLDFCDGIKANPNGIRYCCLQPEYPGRKTPTTSPKIDIIIRGENSPPQQGIEPSPSNIGDEFAWSQRRDGSNPLNYWLPQYLQV